MASQLWGVSAGQARHNSINVGGVTAARWDTTLVHLMYTSNKSYDTSVDTRMNRNPNWPT